MISLVFLFFIIFIYNKSKLVLEFKSKSKILGGRSMPITNRDLTKPATKEEIETQERMVREFCVKLKTHKMGDPIDIELPMTKAEAKNHLLRDAKFDHFFASYMRFYDVKRNDEGRASVMCDDFPEKMKYVFSLFDDKEIELFGRVVERRMKGPSSPSQSPDEPSPSAPSRGPSSSLRR